MKIKTNTWPPPPGEFIKDELEARGWAQIDLAYVLGCPVQSVNTIIAGKRSITPNMAKALGSAFDVSAEFFLNLQRAYDLAVANEPDSGISRRARLQSCYPLREMFKRGWLEETDIALLERQITRYFDVNDLKEVPHLSHAAKKSKYENVSSEQLAWLFRVKQIAKTLATPKYYHKALEKSIPLLKQLLVAPEGIRCVPKILNDCGVKFVLVEKLSKTKIDGVCFWIKSSPVIGMSIRSDRIDNFWFVLRHEIEHVLRRHGQKSEIIDTDLTGERAGSNPSLPEEEIVANLAASDFCVYTNEMNDFCNKVGSLPTEREVLAFSKRVGVHPGIVVGQLQYRTNNYSVFRNYLEKISKHIIQSAPIDGWGNIYPVAL